MNFSERLSCLLSQRGLTQRELAGMCGVDEASMSRYVNGSRKPCMDVLVRIANELNVSVEYLTGNEEEISFKEIKHLLCSNLPHLTDEQRLELMEMIAKKK